ncbi:hypothetical protein [Spirosoma sp. 209]|uniref:hypothetical protein n=1 Tax=Spirosoma sp. 209 TaxID=1955701 RepID=UPI00098D34B0|nr:hypothetical protein [Spirosoma sp. 209]
MKTGAELIAIEREEHTSKHEWTPEHDDAYTYGELPTAAIACIVMDEDLRYNTVAGPLYPLDVWPWGQDDYYNNILKKDRIGQLTVAGALIAAEIDRLQRLASAD